MTLWEPSNHYPLIAHVHVKLKTQEKPTSEKPNYEDTEAMEGFKEHMRLWMEDMEAKKQTISWDEFAEHLHILRMGLPKQNYTLWKPYLTESTKEIIRQRKEAAQQLKDTPQPTDVQKTEYKNYATWSKNTPN